MARINIDMEFFSDNRFEFLSELLSEHSWMTRYRMILLWRGLYLKRTSEVTFQELARMTWWRESVQKLVTALIDSDLAFQSDDEKLTIKGVDKRIAYLAKQAEKGRLGAVAKHGRSQANAKKNVDNSDNSQESAMANSGKCLAVAKKSSGLPLAPSPSPVLSHPLSQEGESELSSLSEDPFPGQKDSEIVSDQNDDAQESSRFKPWHLWEMWHNAIALENANFIDAREDSIKAGTKRYRIAQARIREQPDPDYWLTVLYRLINSKFANGQNDRGWRADFDFFLRPDTHVKAMEGKYDDKPTNR